MKTVKHLVAKEPDLRISQDLVETKLGVRAQLQTEALVCWMCCVTLTKSHEIKTLKAANWRGGVSLLWNLLLGSGQKSFNKALKEYSSDRISLL